jgi:type 1 glutamine amidotransferase
MSTAVIFSGGIAHPFADASAALGAILEDAGFAPVVSFDLDEVVERVAREPRALLVIYALRWSMTQHAKYLPDRERWSLSLPQAARDAIAGHVAAGGGLFGVHTASICFDDWPQWGDVLGGAWRWGRSHHPPLGPVTASVVADHPLTRGLSDFAVNDEAYSELDIRSGVAVAATVQASGGAPQPALWSHHFGAGRVVYDSLGHDAASLNEPTHRQIIQRSARWAAQCH